MTNPSEPAGEPGNLRLLRVLVTTLIAVMIGGFLVIIALFVIRFSPSSGPALPDVITLPDGTTASAFTVGAGWYAVVTNDNRILIYDIASGTLRRTIAIDIGD